MPMESDQIADLAAALAKAQGLMGPAIINKQNPHFKNRYADLAAVMEAVRKPLSDNGLSVTQTTELRDGMLILRTTLRHASGQWLASDYPLPLGAKPQELGSAMTYGRRYELSALVGVAADEDDDGEATRRGNGAAVDTGEVVSEEQCQTLVAALEAREMPVDRLLQWARATRKTAKVEAVDDLPADLYEKALATIQKHGAAK